MSIYYVHTWASVQPDKAPKVLIELVDVNTS